MVRRAMHPCRFVLPLILLLALSACSSDRIAFIYPDEAPGFRLAEGEAPAVYFDGVTDMRPPVQREGEGHFFTITYPKDESWEAAPSQLYAEALAQDLEQANLVTLVPLRGQARYVLSADLVSMSCQLKRSPLSLLLTGAVGAGAGLALGQDGSHRAKLATALGVVGMLAIPVPTKNRAECEVRLTLRDGSGDVVWQASCLGDYEGRKAVTPTARQDQRLVDEDLTRAVKKANACLLAQMRQFLAGS